jgi:hypothetical protein
MKFAFSALLFLALGSLGFVAATPIEVKGEILVSRRIQISRHAVADRKCRSESPLPIHAHRILFVVGRPLS